MSAASVATPGRVPARAWVRPAGIAVVGLALAALLLVLHLWWGALLLAGIAVLLGYWTSPLRSGQHTPFVEAMEHRTDNHAIVLWAPGDPMSARLQTAIRGERPDVTWVNVYRDATAEEFLLSTGGRGALPLVIVGDTVVRRATVGQFLDALAGQPAD